ncbi:hypothetical protein MASR2M78_33200 [Treponema sp.]
MPILELERRKSAAIDQLTERFAHDELAMDEYERLVSDLNQAENFKELAVLEDIVGIRTRPRGDRAPEESLADVQQTNVFLSERKLSGSWLYASKVLASCLLGSQVIDFREVDLSRGTIYLEVSVVLGEIQIIVPEDLAVRMEASAILGDATVGRSVATREDECTGLLIIRGSVLLGSVSVKKK